MNPRQYAAELVGSSHRPVTLSMINGDSWRLANIQKKEMEACLFAWKVKKEEFCVLNLHFEELKTQNMGIAKASSTTVVTP